MVYLGEAGDRRAGGERPGLGCRVVELGLDCCVGVEGCAAGVDVGLEDFGEAWCYTAAAAGVF